MILFNKLHITLCIKDIKLLIANSFYYHTKLVSSSSFLSVQTEVFRVRSIFIHGSSRKFQKSSISYFFQKNLHSEGDLCVLGRSKPSIPCEQHRVDFYVGLQWPPFVLNVSFLWKVKILQKLLQVFYFYFKLISECLFLFKNNFSKKRNIYFRKDGFK